MHRFFPRSPSRCSPSCWAAPWILAARPNTNDQGCEGNTAVFCGDYDPLFGEVYRQRWEEDCGDMHCVEYEPDRVFPTCALEPEPSEFCEGAQWSQVEDAGYPIETGARCVDNNIPACVGGFLRRYVSCEEQTCVVPEGRSAICAAEGEPSALCDGDRAVGCEGGLHPVCQAGYLIRFFDCLVGECVETESGVDCIEM